MRASRIRSSTPHGGQKKKERKVGTPNARSTSGFVVNFSRDSVGLLPVLLHPHLAHALLLHLLSLTYRTQHDPKRGSTHSRPTTQHSITMSGYETVLFVARECFVYRVPPRTSTAGYKAAEWGDMEAFLWKGRLRIMETSSSDTCSIRLEDGDSGELFAECPYDVKGTSVEPVLDSSRYFVLRVESEGPDGRKKKAYIGMGVSIGLVPRWSKVRWDSKRNVYSQQNFLPFAVTVPGQER